MVKHHKIREVVEDAVVGTYCKQAEKTFGIGYDSFQFPFTVSFDCEGKYEVVIKGKHAIVKKVE
jgi:hypothetical protein